MVSELHRHTLRLCLTFGSLLLCHASCVYDWSAREGLTGDAAVGVDAESGRDHDANTQLDSDACVSLECGECDAGKCEASGPYGLLSLQLGRGSLQPSFSPDVLEYRLTLPASEPNVELVVTAPESAQVVVNGTETGSGHSVVVPVPASNEALVQVDVRSPSGATRTYSLSAVRKMPEYVKALAPAAQESFGAAVALGDGLLLVGAPGETRDINGLPADPDYYIDNVGAVFAYARTQGGWKHEAYLKASNAAPSHKFGFAISLSGDTLVVGAPGEGSLSAGINSEHTAEESYDVGAVYVFVRGLTGVWAQQAYIKPSKTGRGYRFGASVSIDGNLLAVGAPNEGEFPGDEGGPDLRGAGAVYIFERTNGTWGQRARLTASNAEAEDRFGASISLSGTRLAVGAANEDSAAAGVGGDESNNDASNSGAVYIFERNTLKWSQRAYLKAFNSDAGDGFGWSVSLYGDTLAVGADYEAGGKAAAQGMPGDNSAVRAGAAYIFNYSDGRWAHSAYLKASNVQAQDLFGKEVALYDKTLVVAAPGEDGPGTGVTGDQFINTAADSGAAYVFKQVGTEWKQTAYLKATNTERGDGVSVVAVYGDTIALGASGEDSALAADAVAAQHDNTASLAGVVYVY